MAGPLTDDGDSWLTGRQVIDLTEARGSGVRYRPFAMESPVEALDLHLRRWEWMGTIDHLELLRSFLRAYAGGIEPPDDQVQGLAKVEANLLNEAVTHYVTPELADVIEQMGQAMPPDMLRQTDLGTTPKGFVVFGVPWSYMNYDRGDYKGMIPIRAIAWEESQYVRQADDSLKLGVQLFLYADWDWVDAVSGGVRDLATKPQILLVDLWAWTYDTWWMDAAPNDQPDQHHATLHVGQMRRNLLALWRFMNEEVVHRRRFRPPRPALRRWGRSGKPMPEDGCIVTVHLRRSTKPTPKVEREGESEIEWSHRWWVRGHYRYNPKTAQKDIWIRPYVKGPEHLPIILKNKLISVDR
jgi:hypothetical protein